MGYFIKDKENIAKVTEPLRVSLSDNPNFIQFESTTKPDDNTTIITFMVLENITPDKNFTITFTEEETNLVHEFTGTTDKNEVNDTVYFVDVNSPATTANNLRERLLKDTFFFYQLQHQPSIYIIQL
ncbi:MAG: hypothetical protein LBV43_05855 [Prevotella sp.]|nr:hypothetical protein [Prevotella sp.]